jgi:hypothetical protein
MVSVVSELGKLVTTTKSQLTTTSHNLLKDECAGRSFITFHISPQSYAMPSLILGKIFCYVSQKLFTGYRALETFKIAVDFVLK